MHGRLEIPTTREAWQTAATGCYWSYGDYAICTVSGPTLGRGYLLTYQRKEIPGPSQYSPNWNTFEAAAHAAGRHAAGKR